MKAYSKGLICRIRQREYDLRYRRTEKGRERRRRADLTYDGTVKGAQRRIRHSLHQKLQRLEEAHP